MAEPGAPAAPPTPPPAALLVASSSEVQTGGTFTVQINVANVKDLTAAPMRLKYDPALLKLVEAKQGPFLAADGVQVIFTQVPRRQPGETTVQIQRVAGATGVSGSGTLATLKFEALAPGAALITAVEFNMRDSKLQPIVAPAPRVEIQVR
jgi:hypothetical protein